MYFQVNKMIRTVLLIITSIITLPTFAESCPSAEVLYKQYMSNSQNSLPLEEAVELCQNVKYKLALANHQLGERQYIQASDLIYQGRNQLQRSNKSHQPFIVMADSLALLAEIGLKRICRAQKYLMQATSLAKELEESGTRFNNSVLDNSIRHYQLARADNVLTAKDLSCMMEQGRSLINRGISIAPSIDVSVSFAVNSSNISDKGIRQVLELGRAISTAKSSQKFILIGHTDITGTDEHNLELSFNRAKAVKQSLLSRFPELRNKIKIDGKGESTPKVYDNSNEAHRINRRVEVKYF